MTIKSLSFIVTRPAMRDLASIHRLISQDSPKNAKTFLKSLTSYIERAAELRLSGSTRDFLPAGVRLLAHPSRRASFLITIRDETLCVLRVTYGGQDIANFKIDLTELE